MAIILITSVFGVNAADIAKESVDLQGIKNVEELKKAIDSAQSDGKITEYERNYILSNTSSEVILAYMSSLRDEIKETINTDNTFNTRNCIEKMSNGNTVSSSTFRINDAISVDIDIEDEAENIISTRGATVTEGAGNKKLGDRKTTGKYKETFLGVTVADLKLTLGYTVKPKKIVARYSSASGSMSFGSLSTSSKITDNIAAQVGHDMNCNGSYDISIAGKASVNIGLTLQVKWYKNIDSQTKYIYYKLSVI